MSDAEMIAYLTLDGQIPLDEIGLVGVTIYTFNRGLGCYLARIVEDNRAAEECKAFLRRTGREFKSVRHLPRP
jgi:hypothetical protein